MKDNSEVWFKDILVDFDLTQKTKDLKADHSNIMIVGLDESGKSTLINCLKQEKDRETEISATVAYKIETFKGKSKINFTCMDMSGQLKYRSLWEKYYA